MRYTASMFTLHRRHLRNCPERAKGWNFTLCDCPIWCDGKLNGERYTRSLQTRDMAQAQRRVGRLERGDDTEALAPAPTRTVASAIKVYLEDAKRRKLRPSTMRSYERTFEALSDAFGKQSTEDLTVDALRQYQEARPVMPRTQRKEIEHLRAFCAFCVERGWLTANPAKKLKPPRAESPGTLPFTAAEIDKLLTACDTQRARALLLTLLYSGLRISDVADLKRAALHASGHLTLRTTKTNVPVKVLLHEDARQALAKLPSYRDPTYFFRSGVGGLRAAAGSLQRTVARIGKRAGVHAHPHRFRDTFAVELLTEGADIRTVQMLLGHESVRTTEKHYAHFVAAHQALLDSAAARLNFQPKPAALLVVQSGKRRRRDAK